MAYTNDSGARVHSCSLYLSPCVNQGNLNSQLKSLLPLYFVSTMCLRCMEVVMANKYFVKAAMASDSFLFCLNQSSCYFWLSLYAMVV